MFAVFQFPNEGRAPGASAAGHVGRAGLIPGPSGVLDPAPFDLVERSPQRISTVLWASQRNGWSCTCTTYTFSYATKLVIYPIINDQSSVKVLPQPKENY